MSDVIKQAQNALDDIASEMCGKDDEIDSLEDEIVRLGKEIEDLEYTIAMQKDEIADLTQELVGKEYDLQKEQRKNIINNSYSIT